jgi:DNA-binding PadR family transcriptional regulator
MSDTAKSPEDFLPLTATVFNILLTLVEGEKHGYAIMSDVEVNTDGQMLMGPGTLYGSIKRMLDTGLIEETDERPDPEMDDQRRRYYKLSGLGQRTLRLEAERLAAQVKVARAKNLLAGWLSV